MALKRETIKITISREELSNFLDIIKELNKISEIHKIKWIEDDVILYSIQKEEGNITNAKVNLFKTFFFKRNQLFSNFPSVNLDYVILEGKKFCQKFSLLLDENLTEYEIEIMYICDYGIVENFKSSSKIYKSMTAVAGDNSSIKDFAINILKERMNPDISINTFTLTSELLKQLIKVSKLESKSNLLCLKVNNGEILFSETQFELLVGNDTNLKNGSWDFKKEYIKLISSDDVEVSIYESYITIKEKNSILLFTLSL